MSFTVLGRCQDCQRTSTAPGKFGLCVDYECPVCGGPMHSVYTVVDSTEPLPASDAEGQK